jgi:ABC-type nitrate/sulfonate/bicarbonate transport system ATPase subunit
MTTLILLTARAPHPLTDELILAGHDVLEALAISEVFALLEQIPEAQVIIAADIEAERAKVIQQHNPTIHLTGNATLKDVLWELELLFPGDTKTTQ